MPDKNDTQREGEEQTEINAVNPSQPFTEELINILEQGIETMGPDFEDKEEVESAREAVEILKQN